MCKRFCLFHIVVCATVEMLLQEIECVNPLQHVVICEIHESQLYIFTKMGDRQHFLWNVFLYEKEARKQAMQSYLGQPAS